jgi:hypothetical protein
MGVLFAPTISVGKEAQTLAGPPWRVDGMQNLAVLWEEQSLSDWHSTVGMAAVPSMTPSQSLSAPLQVSAIDVIAPLQTGLPSLQTYFP